MSVTLYLHLGDCVEVLADYSEGSVGGVVSDPPYEISFMGRGWDATGVAYDPRLWGHLYRVLVPGGVIKAFSATRTFHRLAGAMREAGFTEISVEAWAYGSGFPKSLSVPSAIDKAARGTPQGSTKGDPKKRGKGVLPPREVLAMGGGNGGAVTGLTDDYGAFVPETDAARTWEGWGTALKPSWEPVLVGRKPCAP
jgi:site-specific DNA-methyltransferase (adenine-specific)